MNRAQEDATKGSPEPLNPSFRAFLESSPDPFVVFERGGPIVAFNAAAEELLGHKPADMVGRPIGVLFPALGRDPRVGLVAGPGRILLDSSRPDGSLMRVEVTLTPVEHGSEVRFFARVGLPLRAGLVGSDSSVFFSSRFLTILSHELRTPLQAMLGWVHVLRLRPRDGDSTERGMSAIERNIHQQAHVLDDLSDMMEIATGRLRLDVRRVGMRAVIQEALDQVAETSTSRDIRWARSLPAEELEVLFDPDWLRRVIHHLLGNALRYSRTGGSIDTELRRMESSLGVLVTDRSPDGGEDAFYVYDEFRHGPPASTRDFGGLSIGLANVQRVVELQGGSVRAESAGYGRGATFEITLPIAE